MPDAYNWDNGLVLNLPAIPKTAAEYQELLDAGEYSKLEDMLIAHLDTAPGDIAYYLPAYRVFFRKQDSNRAAAIYGLQVESLKARKDLAAEISLLQAILSLSGECSFTRDHLLQHLKSMYSDSPNFDNYVSHLKLLEGSAGIDKFKQLELWLRYDQGRVVYMPSKGIARVKEANPKFGVVRIILKNNEQLSLRIDEAQRLAQSLSSDHFLARTVNDKNALVAIAQNDPGELLRMLFSSVKYEIMLTDLREMLAAIVPDSQWSVWWARAKKDPRLVVGSGTKPKLNWNDSIADGNAALMANFAKAPAHDKLEMFDKHAGRSKDLAAEMARALVAEAEKLRDSDPSLALEIALSVETSPHGKGMEQSRGAKDLLSRPEALATGDAVKTIAGVKDRLVRKAAMTIAMQTRDDWPQIYRGLLSSEIDASLFKLIYESLQSKSQDSLLDHEIEKALSDPSSTPRFYLWLCKEMSGRPELLKRANWDFLRSLLGTLDDPAFKGHYPALRKLFDPGEVVDRVIETLDEGTGRLLLDALSRDRELEDYRKEDVRLKLFMHFPELHEDKRQSIYVTKEGLEKKRAEFEKLVKEEIPHNTREIQRTREFGDLRENFEYHAARRKQELLSSRAKSIHDELAIARAIEPSAVDTSKISIGTRVSLRPEAGDHESVTLTILGPWDSDPAKNVLSYTSAAGAALLNATSGSKVAFNEKSYIVDAIAVWES